MTELQPGSALAQARKTYPNDLIIESLARRYARLNVVLELFDGLNPPRTATHTEESSKGASQLVSPVGLDTGAARKRYRLAVTDLFVETALDLLDEKAKRYKELGQRLYLCGVAIVIIGVLVSFFQSGFSWFQTERPSFQRTLVEQKASANSVVAASKSASATPSEPAPAASSSTSNDFVESPSWIRLLSSFARAFTFYGFLVLSAVTLWRFGRAMLDQSERLHDRRHALRQGRLFVHLRDGDVSIEEMERAFAWNLAQANAFANILTDAKAPWGAALAELFKAVPELVKVGADAAKRQKEPTDQR